MEAVEKENSIVAKPKHWVRATREFFRDVAGEMKKVTWPQRPEIVGTTVVVIVATIIFSLYLGACDVIFYRAINYLFTRFGAGA